MRPDTVVLNPARALLEWAAARQLRLQFVAQPPGPGSCVCSPPWGPWAASRACSCCGMEARLGARVVGRCLGLNGQATTTDCALAGQLGENPA